MEYAEEFLPEEPLTEDSPEFDGPDLSGCDNLRRGGVAPALVAAQKKWDGMFTRKSDVRCWRVALKTVRRGNGEMSLPDGFPLLNEFFDKCQRTDVFAWACELYEELTRHHPEGELDNALYAIKCHVGNEAAKHGQTTVRKRNPAWRDPEVGVKVTLSNGKTKIKNRPLTEEERKIPEFLQKRFYLKAIQKQYICFLLETYGLWMRPFTNDILPGPIRPLRNLVRWRRTVKRMVPWLRWYKTHKKSFRKRPMSAAVVAGSPGSPSLKRSRSE